MLFDDKHLLTMIGKHYTPSQAKILSKSQEGGWGRVKEKRKEPSRQLPDSLFLVFSHRRTQHAQNPSLTSGEQKGVV